MHQGSPNLVAFKQLNSVVPLFPNHPRRVLMPRARPRLSVARSGSSWSAACRSRWRPTAGSRALESRIAIIFTVEATARPNRIVAYRLVRIHCREPPRTTSYRKCGHMLTIGAIRNITRSRSPALS